MRIFYHISEYLSHRTAGQDYVDCLRSLGHEVTHDPALAENADLAVLHDEPRLYAPLFERVPALRRIRTVAYCVWENEILPEVYKQGLALVDAIWTPSHFSQSAMLPHFPEVHVLPHVVRRPEVAAEDADFAAQALLPARGAYIFLSVIDPANPRKNLEGLLTAFSLALRTATRPIALVLKQYRYDVALDMPGVISLTGRYTSGQMAALYRCCDAYVSAHHAEGWGLGLSQAMAYGKPVIATGWSGNMEYMDETNSVPVPYSLEAVSEKMCELVPFFSPDMRWAVPDIGVFAASMARAAKGRLPRGLTERAAASMRRFSPARVAERLRELLEQAAQQT